MIDIAISEAFAAAGIPVRLGCIAATVEPATADPALGELLAATAAGRAEALGDAPPAEVPAIAAARRAYKALGKDPARYRPAAEALLRRAKQGKEIGRVNAVVDVNNVVSLESGISIGAYDADALTQPVVFRAGAAGESYQGIGRGELNLEGLPVFADAAGPFGSPTSDSARSAITDATRRLLMVLIHFADDEAPGAAVERAVTLLRRHARAQDLETRILRNIAG